MNPVLSSKQLQMLCNSAIQAAQAAGQSIESFDRNNIQRTYKDAGSSAASQLVTQADMQSEEIIRQALEKASKGLNIAFVGEESASGAFSKAKERFEKPCFWCVDPLDGTLHFAEGRSGYAVSIALVAHSGTPLIGVVYDPASHVMYQAIQGQGCYRDLIPLDMSGAKSSLTAGSSTPLTVYADQSFKTHAGYSFALAALESCAHNLNLDGVNLIYGSGAVKNACQVLESSHACYLKLSKKEEGGGSIWDYAATACLVQEAGAWVSDIQGQALDLNRADSTFMNHHGVIFASNEQIAQCLIDSLQSK